MQLEQVKKAYGEKKRAGKAYWIFDGCPNWSFHNDRGQIVRRIGFIYIIEKKNQKSDILFLDEVVFYQREHYKDISRIIFGHTLHYQ